MAPQTLLFSSTATSASLALPGCSLARAASPSPASLAPTGAAALQRQFKHSAAPTRSGTPTGTAALQRQCQHFTAPTRRSCPGQPHPSTVAMGLKAVESFDTSFELNPEAKEVLEFLLSADTFCEQVASQPGVPEGVKMEFTGMLFPPVPWSVNTKHGMPQEYEKYLHDKDNYTIINVPPNFMFKAQIFKPSRLAAIFKVKKAEGEGSE